MTDETGARIMLTQPFEKEPAGGIKRRISVPSSLSWEIRLLRRWRSPWRCPITGLSLLLYWPRCVGKGWRGLSLRRIRYRREEARPVKPCVGETLEIPFPEKCLTYLGNVSNSKAGAFYKAHGVTAVEDAFELSPRKDVPLMFTKHCLRYSMDGALLTRSRSLPIRSLTSCAIRKRSCVCASTARIARC